MSEIEKHVIEVPAEQINLSMFSLIATAKKFLEASRVVVAHEIQQTESKWHPVGKYLACQSIELSLKAFLRLKGMSLSDAKNFQHRIAELLAAAQKQDLKEFAKLTDDELAEIKKASKYYQKYGSVFRYPPVPEIAAVLTPVILK